MIGEDVCERRLNSDIFRMAYSTVYELQDKTHQISRQVFGMFKFL